MPPPPLLLQTTYAELVERCAAAAFRASFPAGGFISKTVNGRRYWYFQSQSADGRKQKYVGRETPELLEQIAHHKEVRNDERERRALVSTLVRSFGMPRPFSEVGNIVAALAEAGVFRLRAVLVGTTGYQTYSAMLGVKLSNATLQTGDIDIAQFSDISVAIGERTPPALEILREVDKTFRPVPTMHKGRVRSYAAKKGWRVDFLTPNKGRDTDTPRALPALQTDAQPLRFLDYLIYEPEAAVLLHDAGIYLNVPAPQRYAIHKLMISRLREEGSAKRDKDFQQAEVLLEILSRKRPFDLKSAWEEAYKRGRQWRQLLDQGMQILAPRVADAVRMALDERSQPEK